MIHHTPTIMLVSYNQGPPLITSHRFFVSSDRTPTILVDSLFIDRHRQGIRPDEYLIIHSAITEHPNPDDIGNPRYIDAAPHVGEHREYPEGEDGLVLCGAGNIRTIGEVEENITTRTEPIK